MWKKAKQILDTLEKVLEPMLPVSAMYVFGAFTTEKKRPTDIDAMVLVTSKERSFRKWRFGIDFAIPPVDLTIAPDNAYGRRLLAYTDSIVRRKYSLRKSTMLRIK
jgi:hypothetical protein